MARTIYVVWDEKAACFLPSAHASLQDANNYIAKRKGKDRGKSEENKQYDALAVTIP